MYLISVLAALNLLPWPSKVIETGGFCASNLEVRAVVDSKIPREGYRLEVVADGITIASSSAAGEFYARRTLEQLRGGNGVPCVRIEDAPVYPWRGYMLDEGRHFFGKETVRLILDRMADYKLNVFHWHLTEDQGWRLDIPGMPELAKYASVRPRSMKRGAKLFFDKERHEHYAKDYNTEKYGPFFYTAEDLREIVAYAAERNITVVPEVDLPGHMRAALAAYPELACFPENIVPRMAGDHWGVLNDVLCAGNPDTIRFLDRVLDYLCEIFPSEVIHIGGDECPTRNWLKCPKCRAKMKELGVTDPEQLQVWITRHVVDYLAGKGRRAMGWDETLAGDVPLNMIGQSWRIRREGAGTTYVSAADGARKGHDMVITPHTVTYLSRPQNVKGEQFPRKIGPVTLEQIYRFDPLKDIPADLHRRVIGSEACLWTEYIWNFSWLEWRSWPRTLALAEVLWSAPAAPRDFKDFKRRAAVHRERLVELGMNAAPLE